MLFSFSNKIGVALVSGTKRTIQMQQLANTYQTLSTIMKLVLVMDDSRELTFEEKLESAFMIPEDEDYSDFRVANMVALMKNSFSSDALE